MPPIKSNQIKESCTSVSSNCVVWQGPNLDCINVCTGESVSETIHSLATTLCEVKKDLDLSDVELQCIIDTCASCPSPDKKLKTVLELIIGKVCDLEELIVGGTDSGYTEPNIALSCLAYKNADQEWIYTRKLSDAVNLIISKLCVTIIPDIDTLKGTVGTQDVRITALEAKASYTPPTVTISCVSGTATAKALDVAIESIASELCLFRTAVGPTVTDINAAASKQCKDLGNSQALAQKTGVNLNTSAGWKATVSSLSDSINNMWIAVCDVRSAVLAIQNNCCKISCDDIVIDFDAKFVDNELYLYFATKSNLPNGFYDYNATLGNKFTFTDANGATWSSYVKLREDVFDNSDNYVNGYIVANAITSPIDWETKVTVTSDISMTDGTTTCVKCMSVEIGPFTVCANSATTPTTTVAPGGTYYYYTLNSINCTDSYPCDAIVTNALRGRSLSGTKVGASYYNYQIAAFQGTAATPTNASRYYLVNMELSDLRGTTSTYDVNLDSSVADIYPDCKCGNN